MTEFRPGDRVRVLNLPGIALDAGKTGTVVWIKQNTAGTVVLCQVRLDDEQHVYTVLGPHELEPEPAGAPEDNALPTGSVPTL